MDNYTLEEHRHRFAVWAAARAAQRGFRKVGVLREALEATGLRTFLANPKNYGASAAQFDAAHREWCRTICQHLGRHSAAGVTFGRAAKLVAVYIKTVVIMGEHWDSALGRNAHPPIDRRLLQVLSKETDDAVLRRQWAGTSWTRLGEDEYYRLVDRLRHSFCRDTPFWMLERHWQPADVEG